MTFTTVFPGWYRGRTIHVHFKIRLGNAEFTSQLFFDEAINDSVIAQDRYDDRGARDTRNRDDVVYGSDGAELVVDLEPDGAGGYRGSYTIGLSGGAGTDGEVRATLGTVSWRRSSNGTRLARFWVDADESVVVTARLIRDGRVLARKRTGTLSAAERRIHLAVPNRVLGGRARLKVTLADTRGNAAVLNRTVRVPRRRSAA